MRYQVYLAHDAEQDIEDLYRYLAARDGEPTAGRILEDIEAACANLSEFPERGTIPKELAALGIADYRELHHKPWRMIYRVIEDRVIVYCVVDGRRDMQNFLERRLMR
ncbi:plasmid stabilization protein [Sinorhizobium glycinis]|uniref:Plasmid stabilization protein n=1 Tax=Sinorhizobium glycinis TaxID=1472378 RepID=A0A178XQQ3_9HYPH|nr:type II toxin-antitoxin system RelE/ParE family toxin [Sinorhizobium glycinis]OAP36885.1 plasmid stabilization protein [Sinorhizobium glycinis]